MSRPAWSTGFTVDESAGFDRIGETLLGGIPLAQGVLDSGGWFDLQCPEGRHVPVEGRPAAFWPDGSVKWLHLCGRVDLASGQQSVFRLGDRIPPPRPALVVEPSPDGLRVADGQFDVRVRAEPSGVLAIERDGAPLLKPPGLSAQLTLSGPDGMRRDPLEWTFEPAEPQLVVHWDSRVVIRLPGRFAAGKTAAGELILFLEILYGMPRVGLQPVFIYLGDPDRDLVASLTLTAHAAGEWTGYGFGNARGRGYRDTVQPVEDGPRWPQARQVQLGSTFYRTEKRTAEGCSWVKSLEGKRAPGWCLLSGERGGLTAAMRHFWQEYPHSLEIDCDRGAITFGLVPAEAPPLDLRRYSPTRWGRIAYEYGEGAFPAQTHGATGIAKASELLLAFDPLGEDRSAEAGLGFARPARIVPEPRAFAASRVTGVVAQAPVAGHEPLEDALAHFVDFLVQEQDLRGWYGLMDYGDMQMAFYSDRDRWGYDDGGYAWLNSESIPDLGLWLSALRHGRSDWLEAAIGMTRHNRDVDTYHRGPLQGCGTRHNVNHWGCGDKEWRVTMPLVRRLHYFLAADPWTREVILNTIAVYQTYERTSSTAPSMSSALAGLMVKYELTHDPADGAALRNLADLYAQAVMPDGHFAGSLHADLATGIGSVVDDGKTQDGRYFFLHTFGAQQTLVELAETLNHTGLKDALVRHADRCLQDDARPRTEHPPGVFGGLAFLALAWRVTGETRFRDAIAKQVRAPLGITLETVGGAGALDEPRHEALADTHRRNKIVCSIGNVLHLYPYGLAALEDTIKETKACE